MARRACGNAGCWGLLKLLCDCGVEGRWSRGRECLFGEEGNEIEKQEPDEASRAEGVLRSTRGGMVGIDVGGGGRAVVGSSSTDRRFGKATFAGERGHGIGKFQSRPIGFTNEKGDFFCAVS